MDLDKSGFMASTLPGIRHVQQKGAADIILKALVDG